MEKFVGGVVGEECDYEQIVIDRIETEKDGKTKC